MKLAMTDLLRYGKGNTILVMVVPPPVVTSDAWVGSKTTVPAEATPQISVNKDNHTNRNALFIIVCFYGILPTFLHSWESIETTEASLVNNKIISPLLLFFIYVDTRSRISRVHSIFATGASFHKAKPTVGCFTPLGQAYSPQKATQASQS